MNADRRRMRFAMCAVAALAALAATPVAEAASTVRCKSADLRYPFRPGGPKTFGVFKLKITGGTCKTAHRIAKGWMKGFEADLEDGRVKVRRTVDGFVFTTLTPNAAQTYRLRGRKGTKTIRFDYVVPNG